MSHPRHSLATLALLAAFVAGPAAAQSVKTEHDKTVDFSAYRTWTWKAGPKPEGKETNPRYEAWEKRLVAWTEQVLESKGLSRTSEVEAQLLATRTLEVKDKQAEVRSRQGGSSSTQGLSVKGTHYREMTWVLQLLDAKTAKPVWTGKSVTEVELSDQVEERVQVTVEKLLKKFPPDSKK